MMKWVMTLHRERPHRSGKAGLAAVVVLLACVPAAAADHPSPRQAAPRAGNDPFAMYDAALNSAASRALEKVNESRQAAPAVETPQPVQVKPAAMKVPVRDAQTSWRRVESLLPAIDPILNRVGVPPQLAAVVLVESGGDPMALSPKGARGLWQLMPDTARRYGLIVNAGTDQRLDVLKSTRAAGEYLRDLYAEFHNWPLALAAYNAGDQAVQQAMAQTGGAVFSTAARALPIETQHYVPAVFDAIRRVGNGRLKAPVNGSQFEQAVYATGDR